MLCPLTIGGAGTGAGADARPGVGADASAGACTASFWLVMPPFDYEVGGL